VQSGDTIDLLLDAMVVTFAISHGTARAADLVAELSLTALALLDMPPVRFTTRWISRDLNDDADAASRDVGLADSQLLSYDVICKRVGFYPREDLFASQGNTRCTRFWSEQPTTAAVGIDGLSAGVVPFAYAFPPFALARKFALRLRLYAATNTPIIAILPSDIVHVDLPSWVGDIIPLPEPSILPPPFNLPYPSPRPLSVLFIRPSSQQPK